MTLLQPELNELNKYTDTDHDLEHESSRFPDVGPCDIEEWEVFLPKSRAKFYEKWDKPLIHWETLYDFDQVRPVGSGTYGQVILIKHKKSEQFYAMKIIEKERIVKLKQLEYTRNEKKILQSMNFPFSVYLSYFFKDNGYIYFVMPYILGGELFDHLRRFKKFNENLARFYISQVILAIEYLHYLNIIYRDIKPENILMDHTGYLKIADFGLCKHTVRTRTYTLCGTPEYLAPEVILYQGYGKAVDWWSTGVLVYEMVAGDTPFAANNQLKIYDNILSNKYRMPYYFSADLKDLVKNLLQVNLTRRFGNLKKGAEDIKDHKWFRSINWMAVLSRKVIAPYKPKCVKPEDRDPSKSDWCLDLPRVTQDQYAKEFADF